MISVGVYSPDEFCKNYKIGRSSLENSILRGIINKHSKTIAINTKLGVIKLEYIRRKNILTVSYIDNKFYPQENYRIHSAYKTKDIRFEKLYYTKLIDKIKFVSGYDVCRYTRNFQSIMQVVINNKLLAKRQNNTNKYFTITFEGFSKCFRFVCKEDSTNMMEFAVYESDDTEYVHEIARYDVFWKNDTDISSKNEECLNTPRNNQKEHFTNKDPKEYKLDQILSMLKSIDRNIVHCWSTKSTEGYAETD